MGKCNCSKRCGSCDVRRAYEALRLKREGEARRAREAALKAEKKESPSIKEEIKPVEAESSMVEIFEEKEEVTIKKRTPKARKKPIEAVEAPCEPQSGGVEETIEVADNAADMTVEMPQTEENGVEF